MARAIVFTFALMLALPAGAALDPAGLQDDGGTGVDASDFAGSPTPLPLGAHTGSLTASGVDGADWFSVTPAPHEKMSILFRATSGAVFFRVLDAAGSQVHQGFSSGMAFRYVGALGAPYRIGFVLDDPSTGATYDVALTLAVPVAQADAGAPGDAGSTASTSRAATLGTTEGFLDTVAGDTRDWLAVTNAEGTWARVSVAPTTSGGAVDVRIWSTVSWPVHWGGSSGDAFVVMVHGPLRGVEVFTSGTNAPTAYKVVVEELAAGVVPQDDAGLGLDAPATSEDAPVLPLGTYEGRLESNTGDGKDAFRVEVPAGYHLRLRVAALMGDIVFSSGTAKGYSFHGHEVVVAPETGDVPVVLSGGGFPNGAAYRFTIDLVQAYDAAILGATLDAPDADHVRNVRIDVADRDELPVPADATVVVWLYPTVHGGTLLNDPTEIGRATLDLEGHETREIVIPWDTTLWFGDFRMIVEIQGAPDMHNEDNQFVFPERVSGRLDNRRVDAGIGPGQFL